MTKEELKKAIIDLQTVHDSMELTKKQIEDLVGLLRLLCPHEAKPMGNTNLVQCEICGVTLDGCLASPDGECHYDSKSDLCAYCGEQKHAVKLAPH